MNTRSSIMKKIFYLLLLAVLTLCICTPVLAATGTTTLTTTVPSCFDLNVTIIGNGILEINGSKLTESGIVSIERNKEIIIKITPNDGYRLSSVMCDDADITNEVKDGYLTLTQLEHESSIIVNFAVDTSTPNTGDHSYPPLFFIVTAIASLLGIVVLLTLNRKKSKHT